MKKRRQKKPRQSPMLIAGADSPAQAGIDPVQIEWEE
jgi:hypothetical protein